MLSNHFLQVLTILTIEIFFMIYTNHENVNNILYFYVPCCHISVLNNTKKSVIAIWNFLHFLENVYSQKNIFDYGTSLVLVKFIYPKVSYFERAASHLYIEEDYVDVTPKLPEIWLVEDKSRNLFKFLQFLVITFQGP